MPHHNLTLLGGPETVEPPETTSENVGQSVLRTAAILQIYGRSRRYWECRG